MADLKIPDTDKKFQTHKLENITYYDGNEPELYCAATITFDSGICLGVGHEEWPKDFKPEIGSEVKLYGDGFGRPIRGLVIAGQVIYYRTAEQEAERHKEMVRQNKEKKKRAFFDSIDEHDARYNALPELFQRRIDRFRATSNDWRWEFEPYEAFCCSEAVKIATAALIAAEVVPDLNIAKRDVTDLMAKRKQAGAEWVQEFAKKKYEEQKLLVPELSGDHSGNTFGFSCRLAWLYLKHPELLLQEHGALAVLVGCHEYGCHRDESKAANKPEEK